MNLSNTELRRVRNKIFFFGSEAKGPAYVESQNGKVMGDAHFTS